MQIFGYFSSNKMKFYGLNGHMGLYACIKRPIGTFNPKAVRLDEKCPPLPLCSAKCECTFEGVPIYGGGGRSTTKKSARIAAS